MSLFKNGPYCSDHGGGEKSPKIKKGCRCRSIVLWFAAPCLFRPIGILYFGGPYARHTAPLVISAVRVRPLLPSGLFSLEAISAAPILIGSWLYSNDGTS